MKRLLPALVTLSLILTLHVAVTYAQDAAGPVVVGYEPGRSDDPIVAQLHPDAAQADIPLFISNSSSMTVTDGLLFAAVRDERGLASAASVEFVEPGEQGEPLPALDLAPGEARRVVMRISRVMSDTRLSGAVSLELDGSSQRLAGLEITRAATPQVVIAEADGDEIKLTTAGPALAESLFLQEMAGAGTGPLTWSVGELRTSSGVAMTLVPATATLEIPAHGAYRLAISGTVPEVGDYRGVATLAGADGRQSYTLRVERTAHGDQLAAEVVPPATVIRWPFLPVDVTVALNLTEAAGASADYYVPALSKLVQVPAAPNAGQPSARYAGATAILDSAVMTQPLGADLHRLAPNEEARWTIRIDDFRSSGHYQGTVRVATPAGEQETQTFDLFTKDPWLLAALAIIVGVLASYGVRRWLESGRSRAIREMAIRRTVDQVLEGIPDPDDQIRRAILQNLSELYETSQVDASTNVADRLAAAGKWLNNYREICSVLTLHEELARLVLDETRRKELSGAMTRLHSDLDFRKLDALGDDGLVTTARELRTSIVAEAQKSLSAAIQELAQIIRAGDTSARQDWLDELSQAEQLLSSTAGGEADVLKRVHSARATYDRVKGAYLQVVVQKLRESIAAFGDSAPPGLEDAAWQELKGSLAAGVTPDMSVKAYQVEIKRYVAALLGGLQAAVAAEQKESDSDDTKKFIANLVADVEAAMEMAKDNAEQALSSYPALKEDYDKLLGASGLEVVGGGREAPAAARPPLPSAKPGVPATVEPGKLPEVPSVLTLPDLRSIRSHIQRTDLLVVVVISIVSTLLGLLALWANAATFGGIVDYINAFLWGFGLHALNQVALPAALQSMGVPLAPDLRTGAQPPAGQRQEGQ